MPIYVDETTTREDLEKLRKRFDCKFCGSWLNLFRDPDTGAVFLACNDWPRTHHEGVEREASQYEREGLAALNIPKRREIMNQEFGEEKTKALDKYIGAGIITRAIAREIVESLWGMAPQIEKTKAILLCQTYQLNPLMKHLYLIPYKRRDKAGKYVVDEQGKDVLDWSMQIGIGATRLMAQRKHNYSYLDMTPRKATIEEVNKILGDTADPGSIYGFVHIKDIDSGAEAYGLRGIPKSDRIKGEEKGNTHLNMACVRAERLALDRQYPGEMPQGIEVVDERYMEADYRVVDEKTGEITELKPAPEMVPGPGPEPERHWCEEHSCQFERKSKGTSVWYAHKAPDGGWCNEAKQKTEAPKQETTRPEARAWPQTTSRAPASEAEGKFGAEANKQAPTEEVGRADAANFREAETSPKKSGASAAEPEGFIVDPHWLEGALHEIRWSEDTAKTWIVSHYKVSPLGTLANVIARLTREQAEEFVAEIQKRQEKQKPLF